MLLLPADIIALLAPFALVFSRRVWRHVPMFPRSSLGPSWPAVAGW